MVLELIGWEIYSFDKDILNWRKGSLFKKSKRSSFIEK
jgi:hypothetical protein